MRYLLLFLLLSGCGHPEPKFVFEQAVTFKVPKFYSLVCDGKGHIGRAEYRYGSYYYDIETSSPGEYFCPNQRGIKESDIEASK